MLSENYPVVTEENDVPNLAWHKGKDDMSLANFENAYVCQENYFKEEEKNSFLVSLHGASE